MRLLQYFQKKRIIFCPWNHKRTGLKSCHNRPQTFFSQVWPGCPNQPRIDFSYYECVPRLICLLICGLLDGPDQQFQSHFFFISTWNKKQFYIQCSPYHMSWYSFLPQIVFFPWMVFAAIIQLLSKKLTYMQQLYEIFYNFQIQKRIRYMGSIQKMFFFGGG